MFSIRHTRTLRAASAFGVIAASLATLNRAVAEDDNPRVRDVIGPLAAIKHHGEPMGCWPGVALATSWTGKNHYQGIARSPGVGMPYLYISQSGDIDGNGDRASVLIVQMASRNRFGERFRSNRLAPNVDTEFTGPPSSDRGIARIDFNSGFLNYAHAGGMAVVGNVLAVPLETPKGGNPFSSAIAFYDITNPGTPTLLSTFHMPWVNAGVVAITKRSNGTYLLLVGAADDGTQFYGYTSTGTDLRDPNLQWTYRFLWDADNNDFGNSEYEWPQQPSPCAGKTSYQNLTFVTQDDGQIYLIGTTRRGSCGSPYGLGSDYMDVFRVEYTFPSSFRLVAMVGRHLYTSWANAGFNGNFVAGGGVHVTPSGQVLLYACSHSNGPPLSSGSTSLPLLMTEFRFRDGIQARTCGPSTVAIELYDDNNGWNDGSPDRSLVYDYDDRTLETWNNLGNIDDFNDRTSSILYCAPAGVTITFHDDTSGGPSFSVVGTGRYQSINDLNDTGWNDRISRISISGTLSDTIYAKPWCGVSCYRTGDVVFPMGGINEALSVWAAASRKIVLFGGNYNEKCVIGQPMVISANGVGGTPVIGLP